jgi:TolB-like protein
LAAGDEYSMADIITFPWIRTAAQSGVRFAERGSIDVNEYPAVKRWYDEIAARPAVQRGLAVPGRPPEWSSNQRHRTREGDAGAVGVLKRVEEIITALSRIRWLFVIARNSSFTYKGQAVDVKQVGRELGVRYVLEGSVRKAGTQVRITGQLIDALTGTHLWADRFDGSLEDVFDLQDKVASGVAAVIEPALQAAETARSASRPTDDLTAYDLYLRAYAMVSESAREISEALLLMEQAIARDPRYGPALAWAGFCCHRLFHDSQSEDPLADRRKGIAFVSLTWPIGGEVFDFGSSK